MNRGPITILEDDENDAFLLTRALRKNSITSPVLVLPDGIEGMAYLGGKGKYADRSLYPLPSVLIVDVKMPRMGGLEFLEWLKAHAEYQVIPTLVLSSSKHESDVGKAYRSGVNSYLVKPTNFEDFQSLVKIVHDYWERCVIPAHKGEQLPPEA